MKTFAIKSTIFTMIFTFGLVLAYIFVKGRNGLQATDGDTLGANQWNQLVTKVDTLEGQVSNVSGAPSGFVGAFNLAICPSGRKPADGTNGTPDLRGEFIRGLDNGRGVDSGRTLASYQSQDWKSFSATNVGRDTMSYSHGPEYMGKSTNSYVGNLFIGGRSAPAATLGIMWDNSEIRPRNVALLYCVRE